MYYSIFIPAVEMGFPMELYARSLSSLRKPADGNFLLFPAGLDH